MHADPSQPSSHSAQPGHVRQGSAGAMRALDSLFTDLLARATRLGAAAPTLREWIDLAEAWRIVHALREARGNRSAAARSLGIGRRTLYTKMEKLGIAEDWAVRTQDL